MMFSLQSSAKLPSGRAVWVGALSFEDRCVSGLERAVDQSSLAAAFIVEYATKVRPLRRAQIARAENKRRILAAMSRSASSVTVKRAYAYRMSSIRSILNAALEAAGSASARLIIDTSCLTKIHCVGLAEWVIDHWTDLEVLGCSLQYSSPEQYGWQSSHPSAAPHYSELIFAPLGSPHDTKSMQEPPDDGDDSRREEPVDAIAIIGHEGSRLRFSISAIGVDRGLAVITGRTEADDDLLMATLENYTFLADAGEGRIGEWTIRTVSQDDMDFLGADLSEFLQSRDDARQVVILPLGPKPAIIQAVLTCISSPRAEAWVSYPVPSNYRLGYSIGVASVRQWNVVTSPDSLIVP